MPIPGASYKRSSRRQPSSEIEEDEDDQHTRNRTNVKHSSTSRKQQQRNPARDTATKETGGDGDADDDDDGERIDIENFRDQPLGRADINKLQGIASDWDMMEQQVRPTWRVITDVAVALVETGEGDQVEEGLAKLDIVMKDLIDITVEMQAHEKALEELSQTIARGEEVRNAVEFYGQGVLKRGEQYAKKTTRQKYAKSEEYVGFKNNIHEAQHPNAPIPPINDFIPREDGDESDDDEDFEMGGVSQNYNCPITLTLLVDPVTSRVCKHSFSREAIMQSFRGSAPIKCPAAGCNKSFTRNDLVPNPDLVKQVKAYERRARRAAEHSDAEEIVD